MSEIQTFELIEVDQPNVRNANDSTTEPNLKTLKSERSDFEHLLYNIHSLRAQNWKCNTIHVANRGLTVYENFL